LLASYKVTPELAPLVRLGYVSVSPPSVDGAPEPDSASGLANPVIGATYALKPTPELKLGLFLGVALPFGSGGGNDPDLPTRVAMLGGGIPARSAMDNALFAMNYLTVIPGAGLAYVASGFTAQVELTVLQLTRVKGEKLDTDTSRTNVTTGVHLGYFVIPELSLGAELRHQRWLFKPQMVAANEDARDTSSFAVGPRVHLQLSDTIWFRPAIAYARPIDKPVSDSNMNIVQIDLPLSF
jgi:hypothetical protein